MISAKVSHDQSFLSHDPGATATLDTTENTINTKPTSSFQSVTIKPSMTPSTVHASTPEKVVGTLDSAAHTFTSKKGLRIIAEDGHIGTIRFYGPVPRDSNKVWFGIEWDDPKRGKHNGEHNDEAYFECRYVERTVEHQ